MSLTESQLSALPEGWCATARPNDECDVSHSGIAEEVAVEVSAEHPLFGVAVEVAAHDVAFDDVLCQHVEDPERFTEVHLTWARRAESFGLPSIECDGNWEDFLRLQRAISAVVDSAAEAEQLGLREPVTEAGTPSRPIVVRAPARGLDSESGR
ncbi:hypothetical protein [Rhodococcus tukisamuensis]|uniref:hypothetical protein n=1 Tax=Rhodococcus tukisamuensis TaxID=168276 RepID=UPI0011143A49|nr:hypothetical protein [Rhodococcus tukisamuensis]